MAVDQSPMNKLITEHIDIWTSAVKTKSASGRGSSKKLELYGVKKLRELILELAVRGKLVPQDSNDEPASVHLKRIAEVKSELIGNKAIRKAKVAKRSDMPPANFETPKGWSAPILENLVINSSDNIVDGPFGSKLKATEYVDNGVPIIRIQNVDRNQFKNNGLQYLTVQKAKELHRHSFMSGDIVINKLGEPTGKACIVPQQLEYGIIVADIVRIRLDSEIVNEHYLTLAINSPFVANQFSGLAKGVTRQRVNLSQIRSLTIPLPPLKEQERINERFNKLMLLCDQLEQQSEASIEAHQVLVTTLLDTLTNSADADELMQNWGRISEHFDALFTTEESIEQLKQTILQLAVMGKLVPQEPSDEPAAELLKRIAEEKAQLVKEKKIKNQKALPPIAEDGNAFSLPAGWAVERLGNISVKMGSGSTPRGGQSAYVDQGVPFLRSQNIWNEGLKMQDIAYIPEETHKKMENTTVIPGDILLNITGASLGRTIIFPPEIDEANVSQHVTIIRLVEPEMTRFIHLEILSPLIQKLVWDRQVGVAIEGLSKKVLEQFECSGQLKLATAL